MWIFVIPPERPDASQWPGRRVLAILDAIVWPALWLMVIHSLPAETRPGAGIVEGFIAVAAVRRVYRAAVRNHRYWFTTYRWGSLMVMMVTAGLVMRCFT